MGAMTSQITRLTTVYSTVYSDADQSKHQSSASLAFVWGIHRGPGNLSISWRHHVFADGVRNLVIQNRQSLYKPGDEISCAAEGNPVPTVQWMDHTGVVLQSRLHQSGFVISSVLTITADMEGILSYSCRASNRIKDRNYMLLDTVDVSVASKFAFWCTVTNRNWWQMDAVVFPMPCSNVFSLTKTFKIQIIFQWDMSLRV